MSQPIIALAALAGLLAAGSARAEIAVITNVNNPATRMFTEQAAQFFLGQSNAFTPIDQTPDTAIRTEFYKKAANKTLVQVSAIWSRIAFSGKGMPPKEFRSNAEVKKAVAEDPKAIAYIDKSAVDDTVKVLLVIP
ncbi:MAG TPA: hypothetical protein VEC06_18695 [Paucimonas sp.]|nr:hypothetical protein [Paucimonas sp.]